MVSDILGFLRALLRKMECSGQDQTCRVRCVILKLMAQSIKVRYFALWVSQAPCSSSWLMFLNRLSNGVLMGPTG